MMGRAGVTAAEGFVASGVACGLKASGRKDLAIVAAKQTCAAAGLFTGNSAAAAPVLLCRRHLGRGVARVVVVNSGCANCATGARGMADAEETARLAARLAGCAPEEVLPCSTGVIGTRLDMKKLSAGVEGAWGKLSVEGGADAAEAIMTTDTVPKIAVRHFEANGATFTVGGMAKGSGMIRPGLATMIAVVTTDAGVHSAVLREALQEAAAVSFNRLTIDGCESTNDSLLALASGEAGPLSGKGDDLFLDALSQVCTELAKKMAADGEGARRLVVVRVTGAPDAATAGCAARAVAESALVKCAVYGGDPNWGRIVAAAGSAVSLDLSRARVTMGGVTLLACGEPVIGVREQAARALAAGTVEIELDMGCGDGQAEFFTCDLTEDYVKINAHYHT